MIEVHLIGYTADLRHLVLDVDANEERGRYRLVVDGDLFATLDDVRQQRWEHGLDVGVWAPEDAEWAEEDDEEDAEAAWEEPAAEEHLEPADDVDEPVDPDDVAEDDEDDLLADLEDSPSVTPDAAEATPRIQSFDRDQPLFEGEDDDALSALVDRASADSADDGPAVRLVPAPPKPEPELEPEPEPVAEEVVEPEVLEDDEWEWVEESVEVDAAGDAPADDTYVEEPAAEDAGEEWEAEEVEVAAAAPPAKVRDSDIPTALPSQLAKRKTAAGLEIPQDAKLTPAEIQAELRKGRSVRAVAKAAGTDPEWVKRWLEPIEAEQARIIQQARRLTVTSRKGQVSALPLAEAVELRLTRRGVEPESAKWDAVRREDGTWRISCKFEEKGKARTASWLWARGDTRLSPASELAREVGWVDRRLAAKR